jgi:REP element-mobilizing transposase RayT
MARPLRIEYPGAFYHITARGNERKDIFRSRNDRERFLSYLASASKRYQAVVHAYCLMTNHYHLLLETPGGNLSQIMQQINSAYATHFNAKRRRAGHLLQGRYHAILVEADEYAKELSRYIHLNPVRAGVAEKPEDYVWSSYAYYVGRKKPPAWLTRDMILSYFGRKPREAQRRYREFIEPPFEEQSNPLKDVVGSTLLGSSGFVQTMRDRYLTGRKTDRDLPAVRKLAATPSPEQILKAVDTVFGNAAGARQVSLYLLHRHSGRTLKEIGARFGISESGVSIASHRVGLKLGRDAGLKKAVNRIRQSLGLSNM